MTPEQAYNICYNKNKRIPELEPIILTDLHYSYCYARDFIKGRWPEAEPLFLTDYSYCYAYYYALEVIKDRWPEAEPVIIKNDELYWKQYCQHFNIKKEKANWKVGL